MFDFSKIKENPRITKEEILSKVGEKQIIEMYIGGSIYDSPILSPLRKENNPSFTIKECDDGAIIWRDWGTGKHGDCFKLVQEKYNCNFPESLNIIATDFKLINNEGNTINLCSELPRIEHQEKIQRKEKSVIIIKEQPFKLVDKIYWSTFGIQLKTLVEYNVYSVKNLWLFKNNICKINIGYSNSNPIYAYKFTNYKSYSYKVYQPFASKKNKWLFNGSSEDIEGFDQLPMYGELLVITKSLKDVMCYHELGISAISLQGEHNKLEQELLDKLYNRFDNILVNYDNDEPGIKAAEALEIQYGLSNFIVEEGKDLSGYIKLHGITKAKEMINKTIGI